MKAKETQTFPTWIDALLPFLVVGGAGAAAYFGFIFWYGASPKTTDVGYAPKQPVPYSHYTHVTKLGMDCRYCHTGVETSAKASIPPTQTCMNCHALIRSESAKLLPVLESHATGMPIPWVKVHDLPDYVYFNHSAHVSRGVGCVSCHGRIDKMEVVSQAEPLSMGWCLDCHRNPAPHIRPKDKVTEMDWTHEDPEALGARLLEEYDLNPSDDCWTCHR